MPTSLLVLSFEEDIRAKEIAHFLRVSNFSLHNSISAEERLLHFEDLSNIQLVLTLTMRNLIRVLVPEDLILVMLAKDRTEAAVG